MACGDQSEQVCSKRCFHGDFLSPLNSTYPPAGAPLGNMRLKILTHSQNRNCRYNNGLSLPVGNVNNNTFVRNADGLHDCSFESLNGGCRRYVLGGIWSSTMVLSLGCSYGDRNWYCIWRKQRPCASRVGYDIVISDMATR